MPTTSEPLEFDDDAEEPMRSPQNEARLRTYDRAARKRVVIAIVGSLIVNAFFFGYGGVVGHQLIQSLHRMEMGGMGGNAPIPVRYVILPRRGKATPSPSPAPERKQAQGKTDTPAPPMEKSHP